MNLDYQEQSINPKLIINNISEHNISNFIVENNNSINFDNMNKDNASYMNKSNLPREENYSSDI